VVKFINLRTARKQRARDAARRNAAERTARQGEGAAETQRRRAEAALEERRLDGHRLSDGAGGAGRDKGPSGPNRPE
jgi:hypothetical protein